MRPPLSFYLAPILSLVLFLPLSAQEGPQERVRFPAETHWAERGRASARASLDRLGAVAPRRVSRPPLEGALPLAVLPVSYANAPVAHTGDQMQRHLFGPSSATMASVSGYFEAQSFGRFQVTGRLLPTVTLPRTDSHYTGQRNGFFGTADRLDEFLLEALRLADEGTDWNLYADPADPTSVAGLVILAGGVGGQCDSGGRAKIWPHRWTLRGATGSPFRTSSATADGRPIYVNDYVVQGANACTGGGIAPNGVLIHEVGHLLGLPDLYDTSDPLFKGPVGHWDLMATGNYSSPETPAGLGAVSRWMLGWIQPETMVPADTPLPVTLLPVQSSRRAVHVPFEGSREFYLLEHRRPMDMADQALPGSGMLIWYVDPDRLEASLASNMVNTRPDRPGVAVIQADGKRDLETGPNRGDAGDPWPGSAARQLFSRATTPPSRSPAGSAAGVLLSGITLGGGAAPAVTFQLSSDVARPLTLIPDSIAPLAGGQEASIQLKADAEGEGLRWRADGAELGALGLALGDSSGVLSGRVTARGGIYTLSVYASTASDRTGSRTFQVEVLGLPVLDAESAVDALLGRPGDLPAEAGRYLDAIGNRNGRYDLGDFVRAVRLGLIEITPTLRQRAPHLAAMAERADS
jgi:M6 family metalloprotease-like protein